MRILRKQYGAINAEAAAEGLAIFAEHTEDASLHPGKHPNIDRLIGLLTSGHTAQRPHHLTAHKIPVSVLVVIYTADGQVLLMERADAPGFWQSVTGSQDAGETLATDRDPRSARGNRARRRRVRADADGTSKTATRSMNAGATATRPG